MSTSQTIVVTGASSGLGEAIARRLHAAGHRVVIAARREEHLARLARDLSPAGHRVLTVTADVTREDDRRRLLERTRDVFGPIDVLVNNAGVNLASSRPFHEQADWRRLLDVNLLAVIDLTHLALPDMVARGHGHVINVASVSGLVATEPLYSASKFGVRGFSLGLRRQLAGTGVTVSLVSPGFVKSEMTSDLTFPMPGPEIVGNAVERLVRAPRREVIVPGYYRPLALLDRTFPAIGDAILKPFLGRRRR